MTRPRATSRGVRAHRAAAPPHCAAARARHLRAVPRVVLRAVLCGVALAGCRAPDAGSAGGRRETGGDPRRGRALVASGAYGCTACHAIPGIRSPRGVAGPPLAGMARRAFIAGQLPNEPELLVSFLRDPPALVPQTGMPDVRLGLTEARDIAAFLYTLEPSGAR